MRHQARASITFFVLVGALGGCAGRATCPATEPATCAPCPVVENQSAPEADPGLAIIASQNSFAGTVSALQAAIESRGLKLFTIIDHSANAEQAGLSLPSTKLFIFGAPKVGTPLMVSSWSTAIDLPQKMLVTENPRGTVRIAYNKLTYLSSRHGITKRKELLDKAAAALHGLASEAAKAP